MRRYTVPDVVFLFNYYNRGKVFALRMITYPVPV